MANRYETIEHVLEPWVRGYSLQLRLASWTVARGHTLKFEQISTPLQLHP